MSIPMRLLLVATTSAIALSAAIPAQADVITDFAFTGGLQSFNVTTTGNYQLIAIGGRGGEPTGSGGSLQGGTGARVSATFSLTSGDVLSLLVGGMGGSGTGYAGSGGGGGSFISLASAILAVAGGGGGAGSINYGHGGSPGRTTNTGLSGGGAGGSSYDGAGGGGGGITGDGQTDPASGTGTGGKALNNGGAGGTGGSGAIGIGGNGGFGGGGGGGGGASDMLGGGGGGGGHGGGAGGYGGGYDNYTGGRPGDGGGGGGSYLNAGYGRANPFLNSYVGIGNGFIRIVQITNGDYISDPRAFLQPTGATGIPEPATVGLFGLGLAGLALARRRKGA